MKRTSPAGRRLGLTVALVAITSCSGSGESGTGGTDTSGGLRADVLASLGENVIVPAQEAFAADAAALDAALDAAADGTGTRAAAQDAWRAAIETWQGLEMMRVGPAGSRLNVSGGQDLGARVYTWPNPLNSCLVDQLTVGDDFDDADALDAFPGTPRGLGVIEYLLFNNDAGNTCSSLNQINMNGTWDALASEIPQRRLGYAAALATLVHRSADDLVDAWAPSGGDFIAELTSPSRSGAVFGSAQEGLNAVSDAMFYLDTETKDMKVAEPAGITGCDAALCPDSLESRWALRSKEHILANLRAFQLLFLGAAPGIERLGYDDLLDEMGASDVTGDMSDAIEDALGAVEAIPGPLSEAIQTDRESVVEAHTAIRAVTDILKADFLSVLDLEAPNRAAGDND